MSAVRQHDVSKDCLRSCNMLPFGSEEENIPLTYSFPSECAGASVCSKNPLNWAHMALSEAMMRAVRRFPVSKARVCVLSPHAARCWCWKACSCVAMILFCSSF